MEMDLQREDIISKAEAIARETVGNLALTICGERANIGYYLCNQLC
jgi:hypothetical protein